ncbi:hypothetical protein NQZ79_g249 [Umbelopsis isabellina]|nr:hypothetical protein NQZ79_g249 [Umbelopsis isabellina]
MMLASYIIAAASLVHAISAHCPPENDEDGFDSIGGVSGSIQESCQCNDPEEGSWTKLLQFNAIVFQDFTTFGSQDILGRLAVGGNLNTPNYLINANSGQQCYGTSTVPWDELALAVGGSILSSDVKVHGHWWTAGSGSAVELNAECDSPATLDTAFPFSDVQKNLIDYSREYAAVQPNLVINADDSVTLLNIQSSDCEHAITLWPCYSHDLTTCIRKENWSVPGRILYGEPNWNGPTNGYPNLDKLLIMNVPVFDGTTLDITTNQPSMGAHSCSLIWNFYPVDKNGNFLDTGSFQLIRNTGSPFQGVILAPRADIIDSSFGVFEGSIFANSYRWQGETGVEIHNTPACNGYHFCLPSGGGGGGIVPQGSAASSGIILTRTNFDVSVHSTSSETSTVHAPGATASFANTSDAAAPDESTRAALISSATESPDPTSECLRHHHKDKHNSHDYDSHKHGDHHSHGDQESHDSHDSHEHDDGDDNDEWHKGHDDEYWQDNDGYYHDGHDHNDHDQKHSD